MTLKQEHYIVGLLGLGSVLVILYLLYEGKQSAPAAVDGVNPPPGVSVPTYPNSQPIKTGDITINGYAPDSLPNVPVNGIQIPTVETEPSLAGGCNGCGSDTYCDDAGLVVSMQKIPQSVLDTAIANLQSFNQKRITFTQGY